MCISDLKEVEPDALLSNTYGDWRDKGYMTRDAIHALLADIYLWRASVNRDASDYQKCVDYCDEVIKAKKQAYEEGGLNRRWGEENVKQDYYLSDYDDMYDDLFGQNGQNADDEHGAAAPEIHMHEIQRQGAADQRHTADQQSQG